MAGAAPNPFDKAGNIADEKAGYAFLRAYLKDEKDDDKDDEAPEDDEDDEEDTDEDEDTDDEDEDETPARGKRAQAVVRVVEKVVPVGTVDRVANLPTPGGLLPLFLALLVFLFAIVPVGAGGETRLGLLWRVVTHGAGLPPSPAAQARAQAEAIRAKDPVQQFVDAAEQAGFDAFWTLNPEFAPFGHGGADGVPA